MSQLIGEIPANERPRERLLRYGAKCLNNEELIAIILRSGTPTQSAKSVSMEILKEISGLPELDKISVHRLKKIKGIGDVKAISLLAAVEIGRRVYLATETEKIKATSPELIFELFKSKFKYITQEKLIAIYLDAKKNIIEYKTIFLGTVNSSTVHPREIFKEAINFSAVGIIIIHNHPTGDPSPSKQDVLFTKKVEETGFIISIPLIDHIIFGNNSYSSYLEESWEIIDEKTS